MHKKYQITRHWLDGKPIDQYSFDLPEELYTIPLIKEYMAEEGFSRICVFWSYAMPSGMPHFSVSELMAEFVDGTSERMCCINMVDGLNLPTHKIERQIPLINPHSYRIIDKKVS